MKLLETILNEMLNVSKPQKKFLIIVIGAILSMYDKVNFRSLARQTGLSVKTFSRWFNNFFNFVNCNEILISKAMSNGNEIIAAFDQSFIEKVGKKTVGKDKFWDGCSSKVNDGLEISLVAFVNVLMGTSFSLEAKQTPTIKEIKAFNCNETRVDFYIKFVSKLFDSIKKYTRYFVADGFFSKKKFVKAIVEGGLHFIGKLRKDTDLWIFYSGAKNPGRGRPKLYSGKCDLEILDNFNFEVQVDEETMLYSGIFFSKSLEQKIKVVAIIKKLKDGIGKSFLFSTDLDLDALKIYSYYGARYQIEFIFREAKQHTGLCDCQARGEKALYSHFNISLLALNCVKLQHYFNQQESSKKLPLSMISYKAAYHNDNMISRFFPKLGLDLTSIKFTGVVKDLLNYGTIYSLRI